MKKSASTTLLRKKWRFYGAIFWTRSRFPICVKNWGYNPRFSTAGRKSFSRTERPPSKHRNVLAVRRRREKRIEFLEKKVQTKDEVLAELMAGHRVKKKPWGTLTETWVPHDVRDQVVDFVRCWSQKTEI